MENIVNLPQVKKNLDQLAEILKRNPHFDLYELEEMEIQQMQKTKDDKELKNKQQLGVHIDIDLYKKAKYKSFDENISLSRLVEKALEKYLSEN